MIIGLHSPFRQKLPTKRFESVEEADGTRLLPWNRAKLVQKLRSHGGLYLACRLGAGPAAVINESTRQSGHPPT